MDKRSMEEVGADLFETIDDTITYLLSVLSALFTGVYTFQWAYNQQLEDASHGIRMQHDFGAAGALSSFELPPDTISWPEVWGWTAFATICAFVVTAYVVDTTFYPDQPEPPTRKQRRQETLATLRVQAVDPEAA